MRRRIAAIVASLALCVVAAGLSGLSGRGDAPPRAPSIHRTTKPPLLEGLHYHSARAGGPVDVRIDTVSLQPRRLGPFRIRRISDLQLAGVQVRIGRETGLGVRAALEECLAKVPSGGVTGVVADGFMYERVAADGAVLQIAAERARFDASSGEIDLDGAIVTREDQPALRMQSARWIEKRDLLLPRGGSPISLDSNRNL